MSLPNDRKAVRSGGGSVKHGASSYVHYRDKEEIIADGGVVVIVCEAGAKQKNVLSHRTRGKRRLLVLNLQHAIIMF